MMISGTNLTMLEQLSLQLQQIDFASGPGQPVIRPPSATSSMLTPLPQLASHFSVTLCGIDDWPTPVGMIQCGRLVSSTLEESVARVLEKMGARHATGPDLQQKTREFLHAEQSSKSEAVGGMRGFAGRVKGAVAKRKAPSEAERLSGICRLCGIESYRLVHESPTFKGCWNTVAKGDVGMPEGEKSTLIVMRRQDGTYTAGWMLPEVTAVTDTSSLHVQRTSPPKSALTDAVLESMVSQLLTQGVVLDDQQTRLPQHCLNSLMTSVSCIQIPGLQGNSVQSALRVDMLGDGNCGFHAISHLLALRGRDMSAAEVRRQVVSCIQNKVTEVNGALDMVRQLDGPDVANDMYSQLMPFFGETHQRGHADSESNSRDEANSDMATKYLNAMAQSGTSADLTALAFALTEFGLTKDVSMLRCSFDEKTGEIRRNTFLLSSEEVLGEEDFARVCKNIDLDKSDQPAQKSGHLCSLLYEEEEGDGDGHWTVTHPVPAFSCAPPFSSLKHSPADMGYTDPVDLVKVLLNMAPAVHPEDAKCLLRHWYEALRTRFEPAMGPIFYPPIM